LINIAVARFTPDDAICISVMRSLVVAAEKTADRIFLFISSDAATSIVTMDNVTRRAIPWLFFRNFITMNFILTLSYFYKAAVLPWF